MRVLITRPERDAADLKARIEAIGCHVTVAPLINIELIPIRPEAVLSATGLVATSRNGLRSLAKSAAFAQARGLPLFAVGQATAAIAHDLGFSQVHMGSGNAEAMVHLIAANAMSRPAKLLHLAGDHLAFDLSGALKNRGIVLDSVEAYRSVAVSALPEVAANSISAGMVDAVILMSPRTAEVWSDVTKSLSTRTDLTKIAHICLSQAVANSVRLDVEPRIEVALQPNADAIVTLVYRLAGVHKTG